MKTVNLVLDDNRVTDSLILALAKSGYNVTTEAVHYSGLQIIGSPVIKVCFEVDDGEVEDFEDGEYDEGESEEDDDGCSGDSETAIVPSDKDLDKITKYINTGCSFADENL